jgi:hypothetical protein
MKVRITFIVLKKDNNISPLREEHLKVYLDDDNSFPFRYISTKNERQTLKEISEKHLNLDFEWIKKELFSFEVLNNEECEVVYLACIPQVNEVEKIGSFYTLSQLSDIGIDLNKNYEKAIFKRGRSAI